MCYLGNEIDILFSVRMPREGALDSATILMISNYARMKVDNLKTDFLKFEPIEYSEKLVSDMDLEVNLSVYTMYNYIMNASHVLKVFCRSLPVDLLHKSRPASSVKRRSNIRSKMD